MNILFMTMMEMVIMVMIITIIIKCLHQIRENPCINLDGGRAVAIEASEQTHQTTSSTLIPVGGRNGDNENRRRFFFVSSHNIKTLLSFISFVVPFVHCKHFKI